MPEFSDRSERRLATCHWVLQRLCHRAIRVMDFTVLCGWRGEEDQDAAYLAKTSKLKWPESEHNHIRYVCSNCRAKIKDLSDGKVCAACGGSFLAVPESHAVDLAPWPIDWDDTERFAMLAGVIFACAFDLGVGIAWGGHWKNLKDMPHFELVG